MEHSVSLDGEIEYTEAQIHCAGMIHSLLEAGMDMVAGSIMVELNLHQRR